MVIEQLAQSAKSGEKLNPEAFTDSVQLIHAGGLRLVEAQDSGALSH